MREMGDALQRSDYEEDGEGGGVDGQNDDLGHSGWATGSSFPWPVTT